MLRRLSVRVDTATWREAPPPAEIHAIAGTQTIDFLHVLAHVAVWTRPPRVTGFELSDLWAWIRYAPALSSDFDLRLRAEWTDLDAHQKAILSDDLGVGVTTLLLSQSMQCVEFVETVHAINKQWPGRFKVKKRSKRGPAKSPDYIGLLPDGRFVILECKGSQSSMSALEAAMAKGQTQKANVGALAGTRVAACLVGGVFIPQYESTESATLVLADPAWEELAAAINQSGEGALERTLTQLSAAKCLALAGLPAAANLLAKADAEDVEAPASDLRDRLFGHLDGRIQGLKSGGPVAGRLEFEIDASRVIEILMSGQTIGDGLGQLASTARRRGWSYESSEDGKEASVVTPQGLKLRMQYQPVEGN